MTLGLGYWGLGYWDGSNERASSRRHPGRVRGRLLALGVAAPSSHLRVQIARWKPGLLIFLASPGHQDGMFAAVLPACCVFPAHDPRTGTCWDWDMLEIQARL
jgi:hypothetical protein